MFCKDGQFPWVKPCLNDMDSEHLVGSRMVRFWHNLKKFQLGYWHGVGQVLICSATCVLHKGDLIYSLDTVSSYFQTNSMCEDWRLSGKPHCWWLQRLVVILKKTVIYYNFWSLALSLKSEVLIAVFISC